jgi:prepilin-type processing-associated H-X9-DG protein
MNRHRISARLGFTWIELVAIIIVIGVLLALLLPALDWGTREAARRYGCFNNLKQIGWALHNYAQANKVFPPGTICSSAPLQPSNQYDVWGEASQTGSGHQGTSFLLAILPFLEGDTLAKKWNYGRGISDETTVQGISNYNMASTDIKGMYCPSRRAQVRQGMDNVMMLSTAWTGGGTDYGGCAGRHAAFTPRTGYNLCDATMFYEPNFYPAPFKGKEDDTPAKRWGIFGRVNVSTTFRDISDGLSNTIMTGELQRITDGEPKSKDGWAIGGPATLFTTGAMFGHKDLITTGPVPLSKDGMLMNNGFFGSPGSDHDNGANYGMADGSVQFISASIDPNIFALLGSMADGEKSDLPD